ncbi:hypothetical protein DAMA08_013700 [Martiniozyma asiatica (nom. inval.)]|nr:hypothetical protein DAMA08_013700 [Martiniozyma asiatica]
MPVNFPSSDSQSTFDYLNSTLTVGDCQQLENFYQGCHNTSTTAKGCSAGAIALWMGWATKKMKQQRIRVRPLYPMLAGVGVAVIVFGAVTPSVYKSKIARLEELQNLGEISPRVVEMIGVLDEVADKGKNAWYLAKYFKDQKEP